MGNYTFGIIGPDENEANYGHCDFEVDDDGRRVGPRPDDEFGLPIRHALFEPLVRWHVEDDVSQEEVRRNEVVAGIQGTWNRFVE